MSFSNSHSFVCIFALVSLPVSMWIPKQRPTKNYDESTFECVISTGIYPFIALIVSIFCSCRWLPSISLTLRMCLIELNWEGDKNVTPTSERDIKPIIVARTRNFYWKPKCEMEEEKKMLMSSNVWLKKWSGEVTRQRKKISLLDVRETCTQMNFKNIKPP